ncbi:MAG: membrane protein insertion efficiency factor YidD [Promicromonosporaceae bacterium]|nr:membrane protein insertion efficiency factor YidD [Promicromonosporaceae bacterium]
MIRRLRSAPAAALVALVRAYQIVISPLTGPTCRYHPSCSRYAIIALRTHGAIRGAGLSVWRVLRCNPWSKGGVDDVPPSRRAQLDDAAGAAVTFPDHSA